MRIEWTARGRTAALPAALLAAAGEIAAALWLGSHLAFGLLLALPLAGLAYCAVAARITVDRWWGALALLLFAAGASVLVLHLPLFQWTGLTLPAFGKGFTLAAALLAAGFAATASAKWCAAAWLAFCLAFGLVDASIFHYSGNAITANDIASIATALNVAGNYSPYVSPQMVSQLLLFVPCLVLVLRVREDRPRLKALRVRLAALACAAVMAVYPAYTMKSKRPVTWTTKGIRLQSALMELLLETKTLRPERPGSYSAGAVAALGEKYPARAATVADDQRPHVIAIMIEAFSDLAALGDFQTDVDYMPFTRRLMHESVSGTALVSTFGGGTARSEWEFLTGNTMGFMPGGSMPFRQFMGDDENSVVRAYRNAGYHTVGMHPFKANGWGRNKAYPALGFEDVYFIDDLEWDDYVRGFVSDRGFVHQVINLFENRDYDAPMFFFGVTMQNHSDYDREGYASTVHLQGMARDYPNVEQYLSLVRETDEAIRELIEYFSAVEEPVQIVFFGDHQPNTHGAFRSELGAGDILQRYQVPFVMWNNYDHPVEHVALTSLNFLPARLMDLTGVQKPSYFCFLSALSETMPAMNAFTYYSGGAFHDYDDPAEGDVAALLSEYNIYQYANMFDENVDRTLFIGPGVE